MGKVPYNKYMACITLISEVGDTPKTRFKLMSGLDSDGKNDVGAIICSSFQIGEKTIKEVIK